MLLATVVEVSSAVAQTRSRSVKRDLLAALLRDLPDDEATAAVAYLSGAMPQGRIGLGYAAVHQTAVEPAAVAVLTVSDVDDSFDAIQATSGKGSKQKRAALLQNLLGDATEPEQIFLRRLILRELRQGALEGVMVDAIARAAEIEPATVRRAVMVSGDLGAVATTALQGPVEALDDFKMALNRPVQPMLAQTAASVEEALGRHNPAIIEIKYDGARVQVHKDGAEVRVFTRTLREVTSSVPDVEAAVQSIPTRQAILDGEAIALRDDGKPLPFQVTMSRFGSGPAIEGGHLAVVFFDALLFDGEETLELRATERRQLLTETVPPHLLTPHEIVSDSAQAEEFLDVALGSGHEGVMVKDPSAPYAAGRRGSAWLKVKPTHTLDLVVLAVEWGSGRRRAWLSNLHLGARDPSSGNFIMLGKTFKGLTDEMLKWQTKRFLALKTHQTSNVVHVDPVQVVEVAFDGVQASSRYPGGMSLRFARVKGYREDKPADQADTIDAVRAIFEHART